MGHYATEDDVLMKLPPTIGPTDSSRLNQYIEEAEEYVDARLALRCTLPISLATHPEWFNVAKNITTRMAAASYLLDEGQRSGDEKDLWRARDLQREAREWLDMLRTPEVPANVPEGASAYINVPYDGGGAARTSTAQFQRSQVTLGDSNHW